MSGSPAMPADCPPELWVSIGQFWPEEEWLNAANVARLESAFDAFADADTTTADTPCGAPLGFASGVSVSAEHSVGYFQINVCNYPNWVWQRLWNAYQNAGTAHMIWDDAGGSWSPWYFSCKKLGLC
jgi:hypothetical protein